MQRMASARKTNAKVVRRGPKEPEEKRALESRPSRKTLPPESQEYECSGDFVEDFRQTIHTAGLAPDDIPKIVNKPHFSLWRNTELSSPPVSLVAPSRPSDSPSPDIPKGVRVPGSRGGDPTSKSSLPGDMANSKVRDKEKEKPKEKSKKKASKIATGPVKSDLRSTPSTESVPAGKPAGTLEPKKAGDRLFTSKGRDKNALKDKNAEDGTFQPVATPASLDGNDQKPVFVVYDTYSANRLKEIAVRCWVLERAVLEVLCKCWCAADRLTTIILMDCGLRNGDVVRLAETLPKISNLELRFSFIWTRVKSVRVVMQVAVEDAIQDRKFLPKRFLVLDGNFISEQNHGLVLSKPSSLRFLSVRYANLDDKAMEIFGNAWLGPAREWSAERPGLEFLDLSRNRITDSGLEHLIKALRFNRSLTTLALAGNLITDLGIEQLCNDLLLRFPLSPQELLERRQKLLQFSSSVVHRDVRSLQRKYRYPTQRDPAKEKARTERGTPDSRKKEKDDNKKGGPRMSGTRISAGNAVKSSPAPSSRGAGSAHPDRTKTAAKGQGKQGMSIVKSQMKQNFPPATSSHSQPDSDLPGPAKTDSLAAREVPSQQRNANATEGTKAGQGGISGRNGESSEQDIQGDESQHEVVLHRTSKSLLELELKDSEPVLPSSVASFVPNFDVLHGEQAGPMDQRVIDLMLDLSKSEHHADQVMLDRDMWVHHHPKLWKMADQHNDSPDASRKKDPGSRSSPCKDPPERLKAFSREYYQYLLELCKKIIGGSVQTGALSSHVRKNLVLLSQDPRSLFREVVPSEKTHENVPHQPVEPADPSAAAEAVLHSAAPPKFQVHVTSASLTAVNELSDESSKSGQVDGSTKAEPEIKDKSTKLHQELESIADNADAVERRSGDGELKTQRLLSSAVPRRSKSAHRKGSLKAAKSGKKTDRTDSPSPDIAIPKECPAYVTVPVEERFNALVDGIIYHSPNGIASDGNRTLRTLNLMSNKVTAKGVFRLMETISRQREEHAQALTWQRPASPPLPASPKPATAQQSPSRDAPEPEPAPGKRDAFLSSAKTDEKALSGKKAGGKRAAVDGESTIQSVAPEEESNDDCRSVILRKRVTKETYDPNKDNIGLTHVETEHNGELNNGDLAGKTFENFMREQRDAWSIPNPRLPVIQPERPGSLAPFDSPDASGLSNTVPYTLFTAELLAERVNVSQYM